MRFFFDTCISLRLVKSLRILIELQGFETEHLKERYHNNTSIPDEQWIQELGDEGGWVIISADPRISRGEIERAAWKESKLTAIFLGGGWSSLDIWNQSAELIRRWPQIVALSRDSKPGSGFLLGKRNDVKSLY